MASGIIGRAGQTFGFENWNLGLGSIGTLFMWLFLVILVGGAIGVIVYFFIYRKIFCHRIVVLGMMGNTAIERWKDRAKIVHIGRAGDKLFLLKKQKRYIPPPKIQIGIRTWLFWEREDGELINIGYENVDEKMRQMGIKFVDTDMRMQRLGIEKNLQFRLQKQTFWEKYGDKVMQYGFIVFCILFMIVLFMQFRKTASAMSGAMKAANEVMDKILRYESGQPYVPAKDSGGSGVIPTMILILTTKFKIWRLGK